MRVYIPSTLTGLARALAVAELGPPPLAAYVVTARLRETQRGGDQEELEYAAMGDAADASLSLLSDDAMALRRRVVVAAEVPERDVRQGSHTEPAAALLDRPVPLSKIVSAHVDEPEAAAEVARAVDALALAEQGDEAARDLLDQARDRGLLWYARQEIADLVEPVRQDGSR